MRHTAARMVRRASPLLRPATDGDAGSPRPDRAGSSCYEAASAGSSINALRICDSNSGPGACPCDETACSVAALTTSSSVPLIFNEQSASLGNIPQSIIFRAIVSSRCIRATKNGAITSPHPATTEGPEQIRAVRNEPCVRSAYEVYAALSMRRARAPAHRRCAGTFGPKTGTQGPCVPCAYSNAHDDQR
jgi:hypothetical protein